MHHGPAVRSSPFAGPQQLVGVGPRSERPPPPSWVQVRVVVVTAAMAALACRGWRIILTTGLLGYSLPPSLREGREPPSAQRFRQSKLGCPRCPFLLGRPPFDFASRHLLALLCSPDPQVWTKIGAELPDCSEEQMTSARPMTSPHLDHLDHYRLEPHPKKMRRHTRPPAPYLWSTEPPRVPGIISEVDSSPC